MPNKNQSSSTATEDVLAARNLRDILNQIKVQTKSGSCLVVFDLDSTLYDLALRVTAILHHFAKSPEHRQRYPEECSRLMDVEILKGDWGLREPLGRLGLTQEQYPAFWRDVHNAWVEGFFSNRFLNYDRPLAGAVRFVEDVLQSGADVLYLTGRDVERMGSGTHLSLRETGFPLDGVRSRLVLKPYAELDDGEFKAHEMQKFAEQYQSLWLFENEPVNINAVLKSCPTVKMVFIDTCHSGLETLPDSIYSIPHFEVSIEELE